MNLQHARDWADLVLKLCSVVALVAGGTWAYYQFRVVGTTESNIQLTVTADALPYSGGVRLLVVHAKPKNIGKVPIELPKTGFVVSVRALPKNAKGGPLDISKLPELYKTDLLQRFPDGYRLEPGVEYDELYVLLVPPGLYAAQSVLSLDARDELDHTILVSVQ